MPIDLCKFEVSSPIWGVVSDANVIELRLDCGDSGYLKFTPAQAREAATTLNGLVDQLEEVEGKAGILKSFIATLSDNLPLILVGILILAFLVGSAAIGINCHN